MNKEQFKPNYLNYTDLELVQVYGAINKEKNPENYTRLCEAIRKKFNIDESVSLESVEVQELFSKTLALDSKQYFEEYDGQENKYRRINFYFMNIVFLLFIFLMLFFDINILFTNLFIIAAMGSLAFEFYQSIRSGKILIRGFRIEREISPFRFAVAQIFYIAMIFFLIYGLIIVNIS